MDWIPGDPDKPMTGINDTLQEYAKGAGVIGVAASRALQMKDEEVKLWTCLLIEILIELRRIRRDVLDKLERLR